MAGLNGGGEPTSGQAQAALRGGWEWGWGTCLAAEAEARWEVGPRRGGGLPQQWKPHEGLFPIGRGVWLAGCVCPCAFLGDVGRLGCLEWAQEEAMRRGRGQGRLLPERVLSRAQVCSSQKARHHPYLSLS